MATKKRTLCFAFVLYPDNPYQMQLFDWLTNAQNQANFDFRVMYILHAPEEEEKKEHYHFMIKYPNPRTADGVRKSFGVVRTVWRLYIMSPSKVTQKLTKCGKGEKTLSGYKRQSSLKYELTPVLSDKNIPDSYIELPYHDGEKMPPKKPGLDDEIYKLTPVYTVSHVENVSDFRAYAQYILHNTYECHLAHKRQYKISDVKGNSDFIQLAFSGTYSESEMSVTGILQLLGSWRNTNQQLNFIEFVYAAGKPELVEFIRKNPYFVSKFLLGGK